MGNRYTFQFQGSGGCCWKHRMKESSTSAAAASVMNGLMLSRSCLRLMVHCPVHLKGKLI